MENSEQPSFVQQTLRQLGFDRYFQAQLGEVETAGRGAEAQPARVAVEHRGGYELLSAGGELFATLSGNLRHNTWSRSDLPAVGDWVLVEDFRIKRVLKRKSVLAREVAGNRSDAQVIAANLDVIFVVTSLNRDFNVRRLERYLTAAWDSGAQPMVVLNKADLCESAEPFAERLGPLALGVPVLVTSALRGEGVSALSAEVGFGRTAALVGSSGVGKSTLTNALLGQQRQAVREIREDDAHGRHTTTKRELLLLPDGGLLIDTPGMRELRLYAEPEDESEAPSALGYIEELATGCRFRDCSHQAEPGCAVRDAVSAEALRSYHKLCRELAHQRARQDALFRKQSIQKWKQVSKMAKARRRR